MQQMRKILIGMPGELAPAFNGMAMMMVDHPHIKGSNLFIGDYKGQYKIGAVASTEEEWNALWETLGDKPPGPLPQGAIAVFEAARNMDRNVMLEPLSILQNGQDIMIAWNRVNISHKDQKPAEAHPHYTVLLIPDCNLTASFMDSWPVEEERKKQEQLSKTFEHLATGIPSAISAPEKAVFTKKYKNMHIPTAPTG